MFSFRDVYPNLSTVASTAEATIPELVERMAYVETRPSNEPETAVKAGNIWLAVAAAAAILVILSLT